MHDNARICRELASRAAVLAGDEAAWRAWYDESYEPLRKFVYWRTGRQLPIVDEIVQETWLIAVRQIRHFDPRQGAFLDWLRGIAGNVIRNRLRRRDAKQVALTMVTVEARVQDETLPQIEAVERAARVAEALATLPEHYAAVLQARYFDQQSVSEIARVFNQTVKAIESQLTRARAAFREQFGEDV